MELADEGKALASFDILYTPHWRLGIAGSELIHEQVA